MAIRIDFSDALPFKMDGVYCKLIQLTKGQFAIVDARDYERLSAHKWLAWPTKPRGGFYAARYTKTEDGSLQLILMHREILGLTHGDERESDHVEPLAKTDNRRKNLRIATGQQNHCNCRKRRNNTSGFKGVSWHRHTKQFVAYIRVNGKPIFLGYRRTPEDAAQLYAEAALKHHGEFARVT